MINIVRQVNIMAEKNPESSYVLELVSFII